MGHQSPGSFKDGAKTYQEEVRLDGLLRWLITGRSKP
jgi:hypothetical protein